MPDNNSTDNAYLGNIWLVTKYIVTGITNIFVMHKISKNFGFLKVNIRSWKLSWMRFKNNNNPRITRMYGEKNSPKEGNMIPDIVEARIEKDSTSRILVS